MTPGCSRNRSTQATACPPKGPAPSPASGIDPRLGFDPFSIGVLDLDHLAHRVRRLDCSWVCVPPREHQVHAGRLCADQVQDLLQVYQPKMQGVVDFVRNQQIDPLGIQLFPGDFYGLLSGLSVFLVGKGGPLDPAKPIPVGMTSTSHSSFPRPSHSPVYRDPLS